MTDPRHIRIDDYAYDLPAERIARFPMPQRDHSRLLVYDHGHISDDVFTGLPERIPDGSLMVFNNTRVIQARLHFRKATGALIEVFLLEPLQPADYERVFQSAGSCSWLCMIGNLKKWKEGPLTMTADVGGRNIRLTCRRDDESLHQPGTARPCPDQPGPAYLPITFTWEHGDGPGPVPTFAEILEAVGELPIPPYLEREAQESDKTTYQTVYSKIEGSVAAPTAGLHFTDEVLLSLDAKGVEREELTLHVGAGTFRPVKSAEIEGHTMHTEHVAVRRQTIERLIAHGGRATAVGTTSVRTLESLYYMGLRAAAGNADLHVTQWEPYDTQSTATPVEALGALLHYMDECGLNTLHSSTQIIIVPGYKYKITERLITNFHQPRSTLLLLVSAFIGPQWRSVYDHALAAGYRFLSYGDSSLLIP